MTENRLPLVDLLEKAGDGDFLRAVAEAVLQLLMEADVEGLIGAGRHERSPERLNYRNGFRARPPDTRPGSPPPPLPASARSSSASPSSAKAATSRRSWSRARPARRRWWR